MSDRAYLERLFRELTDKGKIIEAGWIVYRLAVVSPDAGKDQLEETRIAFFAGAQHLFSSIMTIMEEDKEPTDADMLRMELIDGELKSFAHDFSRKIAGTEQPQ